MRAALGSPAAATRRCGEVQHLPSCRQVQRPRVCRRPRQHGPPPSPCAPSASAQARVQVPRPPFASAPPCTGTQATARSA
eukprot:3706034-Pleurochrysis_carterae.AAC.1